MSERRWRVDSRVIDTVLRQRQRAQATVWLIMLVLVLGLLFGLLADGAVLFADQRWAAQLADSAARAGASQLDEGALRQCAQPAAATGARRGRGPRAPIRAGQGARGGRGAASKSRADRGPRAAACEYHTCPPARPGRRRRRRRGSVATTCWSCSAGQVAGDFDYVGRHPQPGTHSHPAFRAAVPVAGRACAGRSGAGAGRCVLRCHTADLRPRRQAGRSRLHRRKRRSRKRWRPSPCAGPNAGCRGHRAPRQATTAVRATSALHRCRRPAGGGYARAHRSVSRGNVRSDSAGREPVDSCTCGGANGGSYARADPCPSRPSRRPIRGVAAEVDAAYLHYFDVRAQALFNNDPTGLDAVADGPSLAGPEADNR